MILDKFHEEYSKYKWEKWEYNSNDKFISLKTLTKNLIPHNHGVYIIRASVKLSRVKGKSDLVYIGQSGGKPRGGIQGIGGRIFNRRGQEMWILSHIERMYPNSIFFIECYFSNKKEDPKQIEDNLLRAYLHTHYELPPGNNQSVTVE